MSRVLGCTWVCDCARWRTMPVETTHVCKIYNNLHFYNVHQAEIPCTTRACHPSVDYLHFCVGDFLCSIVSLPSFFLLQGWIFTCACQLFLAMQFRFLFHHPRDSYVQQCHFSSMNPFHVWLCCSVPFLSYSTQFPCAVHLCALYCYIPVSNAIGIEFH